MSREVVTIPRRMSMRDAAGLLRRSRISGAPVLDEQERCVGVLSAADFVRWAEEGCPAPANGSPATCSYQVKGHLLTGEEEAVICTLAEGSCPLQEMRPGTDGRHTAICLQPHGVLMDWQQVTEDLPGGTVGDYMTTDVVSAGRWMPLPELARMMVDAHIHRVPILDEQGRPVGIVSSTNLLGAIASDWLRAGRPGWRPHSAHAAASPRNAGRRDEPRSVKEDSNDQP
jgi:CBS domain-containing protein